MVRFSFRRRRHNNNISTGSQQLLLHMPKRSVCTAKRSKLLLEFLSIAKQNGVFRDGTITCDNSSCGSEVTDIMSFDEQIQVLQDRFPSCTQAELTRFLRARNGNLEAGAEKLQEYMDWRELHGLDTAEYQAAKKESASDGQDWDESCEIALKFQESLKEGSASIKRKEQRPTNMPQVVFCYTDDNGEPQKTLDGRMVVHVLPARIDNKIASGETYALAMGLYLDRKLDRDNLDLATLMLDVRGGQGWPNPPAYNMMPFIRSTTSLLHQHYPERLDKTFVYPLPRAALWIWEMAKPFLNKSIVDSVTMISGSDKSCAPPPNDELSVYVLIELLEEMEKKRRSYFT